MGKYYYGTYPDYDYQRNNRRTWSGTSAYRMEGRFRSDEEQQLLRELIDYRRNGCDIYLDGRLCRPERIVDECLREHRQYMRDFLEDDDSIIRGINFIRIRGT